MHTFHEKKKPIQIAYKRNVKSIYFYFYFSASNSLNLNYLFNLQNWNVICDNDAFFKDHLFAMLKRKDEKKNTKIQP